MQSNPPGPNPPDRPKPEPSEQAWISPRLRAKLDEAEPGTPREGPPAWIGILLAVLVVAGGAGLFAAMRSGAARDKARAEQLAKERATAAAADSIANAARIDSMRVAAHIADSLARASGKVVPPPAPTAAAKPAAGGAPKPASGTAASAAGSAPKPPASAEPPAPKPAAEKGPFGLDVGTFLDEDRAKSELDKLSAATGLKGRVVTRDDVFHVVLGSFPTRAAADRRAEALVGKALVSQAQSVPLSP